MKKILSTIFILSLILFIALSFRMTGGKFGPHLTSALDKSNNTNFIVWIYLKDKGPDAQQKISNPLNSVTQRSLDRRAKVRAADDLVDITDVPIYDEYINQISQNAVNLRQQVKFMNAVSAEVTREQLNKISGFDFVTQVELVETMIKQKDNVEQTQTVSDNPQKNIINQKNNVEVDTLNYGPGATQITQMNVNLVHDQGIFGQGILICSQDDGFRFQNHQAFTNPLNPLQVLSQYDFQLHLVGANHTLAAHGSTTIACIGAYDPGNMIGTAFKSKFIVARTEVDSFERPIEMDNWLAASQWADSLGADIITSSLGYLAFDAGYGGYTWQDMNGMTMPVTRAAANASHNGILVFNSAGNNYQLPNQNTLNGPADADSIINYGSCYWKRNLASFSSAGPTTDNPHKNKT